MKKIYILILTFLLIIGCNSDDDVTEQEIESVSLLGDWNLIAIRFNSDTPPLPDDELEFIDVESQNQITFSPNNIISSNSRSLCTNNPLLGNPSMGTYTLADSTYTSEDCGNPNYKYPFEQNDSIIIINYPGMGINEGKFKKIADLEE